MKLYEKGFTNNVVQIQIKSKNLPSKSLTVIDTSIPEVYGVISKALQEAGKIGKKKIK